LEFHIIEPGYGEILLDRPPAHPIGLQEVEQLVAILDRLEDDGSLKVVCVRSTGPMFCAGADIAMMERQGRQSDGPQRLADFARRFQDALRRLRALPACTIAEISGTATGGGLELALSCDIRVVGRAVRLGVPEILLGLIPAAGGTQLIAEIAGKSVASRMVLTGELIDGREAHRLNLVHYLADDAQATCSALCRQIAERPREAIAAAKRCIALAPSEEGYAAEIDATLLLHRSDKTKELVRSFIDSRRRRNDEARNQAKG
jgi:enoyl-CoA hydratase/carnithine racemase